MNGAAKTIDHQLMLVSLRRKVNPHYSLDVNREVYTVSG